MLNINIYHDMHFLHELYSTTRLFVMLLLQLLLMVLK